MIRLLLPYVLTFAVGGGGVLWVKSLQEDVRDATARAQAAEREMQVKELVARQAQMARDVARAEAERFRESAEEYDRLRERVLNGNFDDPLPDWLQIYITDLLGAEQ